VMLGAVMERHLDDKSEGWARFWIDGYGYLIPWCSWTLRRRGNVYRADPALAVGTISVVRLLYSSKRHAFSSNNTFVAV
jgi:hypothetical protein